jgi:Tol biopolymer transport system component/DNA-binding winged helix-turn-helix (wHTH) protein
MPQSTLDFGRFSLDLTEHRLLRDGEPVPLTPRVFDLLRVLVENAGRLVEKERLLKEVWTDAFVEESNLNRAISVLRRTLAETDSERYIETVPKRGYRFVAVVRKPGTAPPVHEIAAVEPPRPPLQVDRASRARVAALVTAAVVAVIAIGATLMMLAERGPGAGRAGRGSSLHRQLTFTGSDSAPALSPDGSRIAYVSRESPRRKVIVQDVDGARRVELFSAPEAGALRWSPNGSELMFWARGDDHAGQYIAAASGGGARRIALGFFVSCWSPDGTTVALGLFVRGRVMFLDRAGKVQRTVTLQGTRDWIWDLDWSPAHGRLLIVADDEQRRPSIWTIRPDGREQAKALTADAEILAARWAPSGDAVYYFSRVNQTVSLFKVLLDPTDLRARGEPMPLVTGLETDEGFGISADGRRLVYARAPYYSNLWQVEIPGTHQDGQVRQTQLTHGTAVIERPRVSPDGETVVFNMGYESGANLYTLSAAGGPPRQLTFFNAFSIDGAWSADGQSVAFASTEGGKARVWVVGADGRAPHPVSDGEMSESFDVTWAPSDRILYQQTGNRNFYVVDPGTRKERLLIRDGSVGWVASPEYSPDGKQVAVGWNRRPVPGVWLIDANDSRERLVYGARDPSQSTGGSPIGWSPDGRSIITVEGKRAAYRGVTASFEETLAEAKILRVPVGGGQPETLLQLPFEEVGGIAMFPDARRFVASVYSSRSDVWVVDDFDTTSRDQP